jgi:hypothetical protein
MLPEYLLPENVVRENGIGPDIELRGGRGKLLQVTLGITRIVEQESLEISIWGSSDGSDWGHAPIAIFPQKFYCGTYSQIIDLTEYPRIGYLRTQWSVTRWGRAESMPLFGFYIRANVLGVAAMSGAVA